jgi:hypothetical protein
MPSVAQLANVNGPVPQFFTASGIPLAGGKLYSYASGTSTPLATYSDPSGTIVNTNPIILNAGGFPVNSSNALVPIYLKGQSYKLVLKDSLGVQQWSVDNLTALAPLGYPFLSNTLANRPTTCSASIEFFVQTDSPYTLFQCNSAGNGWNAVSPTWLPSSLGTAGQKLTVNPGATAATWASNPYLYTSDSTASGIGAQYNAQIAALGTAPTGGEVQGPSSGTEQSLATTITFASRNGVDVHNHGFGLSSSGLKWAGAANGTMFTVDGGVTQSFVHDFALDGNYTAGIGFNYANTTGTTASRNQFSRLQVWNVTGTPGYGIVFGGSSVDNSQTELSNCQVDYDKNTMVDEFRQVNGQSVANHIHDCTYTYTGTATAPNTFMHFTAGDASVDNVTTLGPLAQVAGNGHVVVEPAALWARFTNMYHEVASGTTAAPVYEFPTGNRVWPAYLKGVRIKWEASDAGNKIIDYDQKGTLSIEDGSINSDTVGNPGHGTISFGNSAGSAVAMLRWRNNPMYPNDGAHFTISPTSNYRIDYDATSGLFASSASVPSGLYSDTSGYANFRITEPSPRYLIQSTLAAADEGTWGERADATHLYFSAYTDNIASSTWWLTVTRGTGAGAPSKIEFTNAVPVTFTGGLTSTLYKTTNLLISATAPTISSGFGTSPSVAANNGTAAFTIDVGTGGTATNGVIGLPTATTGWNCFTTDITARAAHVADTHTVQTASTTASATIENQTISTGAAVAWTASDIVRVSCFAY